MWYRKIQNIDRRIIYIIMALSVAIPLLVPIGMPISINQASRDAFDTLDKLPAGSKVIYSFDYSGGTDAELGPQADAMIKFSFKKGHKVFLFSQWAEGATLASVRIDPIAKEMGKEYGKDYINLGYRPSPAAVLERARTDLIKALNGVDIKGAPLEKFPIMEGVTKASNFDCVASYTTGSNGLADWIFYWYSTGDVKTITGGVTSVNFPVYMPRYQAGQIKGFLGGLRGAAEMEILTGFRGAAGTGMDAQSMAHLAIVFFLFLGNIGYVAAKRAGETVK